MVSVWYKNKKFWIFWVLHAVVAVALTWFFVLDLFQIIAQSVFPTLSVSQKITTIAWVLLPLWAGQFFVLHLYCPKSWKMQWFIVLGSYVLNVGFVLPLTLMLLRKTRLTRTRRYVLGGIVFVIVWWLLREVMSVITIALFEFILNPLVFKL